MSANSSDTLNHLEYVPPRHAFSNTTKIDTVYNANNRTWQGIHDSITMAKNHELFETDFIVQDDHSKVDSIRVNIPLNTHCMPELLLLDNTKVLCLFDTGFNVNLISESVIKSREYFSSTPILNCLDYTIRNITGEINANQFIELCFRVKNDFILTTTALVVPDLGSVKFLLSISTMNHLNNVIDVSARQILIRKKSFVFKTSFHNMVKVHNTKIIGIKCSLPKQLRNGEIHTTTLHNHMTILHVRKVCTSQNTVIITNIKITQTVMSSLIINMSL